MCVCVCSCMRAHMCTCFLLWNRVSVYSSSWPWTQDLVSTSWVLELQAWATIPTIVCLCIFIYLSSFTFHTFFYFICFFISLFFFITHFIFWMIFVWASYLHRSVFGDIRDFCIVFNIYQGKSHATIGSSCLNIQTEDFRDLSEILRLYWIFVSPSMLSVRSSLKCGNPVALVTSAKC